MSQEENNELQNLQNLNNPNIINNSSNNSENSLNSSEEEFEKFKLLRKFLNDEENLLGKVEKNGVRFTRKFVSNILNQNIRLYYTNVKSLESENVKITASLCIVHGFGHHAGEFYELAYFLAKNGINCHLLDMRGHGYSGGCRLDWTIEDLHTDILTLIKQAEADGVDLPIYMFGHSMGGGLVASLFINNQYLQVNGIILSSPLLGLPMNIDFDPFKFFILSKAGNNMREFVMNGNINPSELCKDEREIMRIINDKKIIPMASPRSFRSMIKNCERVLENCRYFNLPCLVLHGEKDRITNPYDSKFFIDNIKHKIKELYLIKDGLHEMYLDYEKGEFRNKVLTWINKTKNFGKTDKPFPIDIIVGPPRPIYNKLKFSILFRIILFILYFYIAYKTKSIIKSKLGRLIWPVSLLNYFYNSYLKIKDF